MVEPLFSSRFQDRFHNTEVIRSGLTSEASGDLELAFQTLGTFSAAKCETSH